MLEPDFDGILLELKLVSNWVLAKPVVRGGKITKPPFQPNGKPASHSDPRTWSSFDSVRRAYQRGGYLGVGFVLDGKPHFGGRYLHGFDWDHCIEQGVLDPIVEAEIKRLAIPRIETSVSGTGIRGFFLHDVPLQSRRTQIAGRSVELYSTERYMTTTGQGTGGVGMSVNIPRLMALFPKRAGGTAPVDDESGTGRIPGRFPYDAIKDLGAPFALPPEFVAAIEAIRADPYWGPVCRGDISAYDGDHSRADLALAGAFARHGLDAVDIDNAFRTSDLYRDKWEREDYRNGTIAKALQGAREQANGPEPDASQKASEEAPEGARGPTGSRSLLDASNGRIRISTTEPLPRDYILDGLLLPGKSVVGAGFGGVSKTQYALQLSTSIVLGLPFMGRTVKRGKVLVLLGEEDKGETALRLSAIVRRLKLSDEQISRLEADMLAFPLVGCDVRLAALGKQGLTERTFAQEIIDAARAMGGVVLITFDHLGLFHGGDHNAREDAAFTMRVVNHIAQETGAAVLLLAHTPKGASDKEESDASMVAGSTAFVDQARGTWVLATMRPSEAKNLGIDATDRKGYVSLTIVKNNYGPTGEVIWFKRVSFDGVGLLEHVILSPPATGGKAAANLEAKIIATIIAHPGQYSKTRFRETQSGAKGPLKVSKGDVERAIEDLLKDGRLVNRVPSPHERAHFGLGPRVTHVLDVGGVK